MHRLSELPAGRDRHAHSIPPHHFTEEETEAQRGTVVGPTIHSRSELYSNISHWFPDFSPSKTLLTSQWQQSKAYLIPLTKTQLFWTFNKKHSLIPCPSGVMFSP